MRDAVAVNTSQEAADKTGQLIVLEHGENPGTIDTGIGSSRVSMEQCCFSWVTVGEGLVPHVESSLFWFTDVEITQKIVPTALGY